MNDRLQGLDSGDPRVQGLDGSTEELSSNIYYVRTTGNDSNDGLSAEQAWLTLQHAADSVIAGDTVYIGAGTFDGDGTGNLGFTIGSSTDNPIRWIGDMSGAYTGDSGEIILNADTHSYFDEGVDSYQIFYDIVFKIGVTQDQFNNSLYADFYRCTFYYLDLSQDDHTCIYNLYNCKFIFNNTPRTWGDLYIEIGDANYTANFYNCSFSCSDERFQPLTVDYWATTLDNVHLRFKNCAIYSNYQYGFIRFTDYSELGPRDLTFIEFDHNCYHCNNETYLAVKEWRLSGPPYDDEIAYNFTDWKTTTGQDEHSFLGDPLYVSNVFPDVDLHLQSTSPCIKPIGGIGFPELFTTDFDLITRVLPFDIGAYEYASGKPPRPPYARPRNYRSYRRRIITSLSYTFCGLPPGCAVVLTDDLYTVHRDGLNKNKIIRSVTVPETGLVRFDGLRDSIYSLVVLNFDQIEESRPHIFIGDRDKFELIHIDED